MNKAHKRIQQFYDHEMSGMNSAVRRALGRRFEVDARFRAIANYLEELAYPDPECDIAGCPRHARGEVGPCIKVSPGAAGLSVRDSDTEATPGDVPLAPPVGRHSGAPGVGRLQDRLFECDEGDSEALQELRAVIDHIGWESDEQKETGDYLARLRQVAFELPAMRQAASKLFDANVDLAQARIERDKAAAVVAAARHLEAVREQGPGVLDAALDSVAKAVSDYDLAEMPF